MLLERRFSELIQKGRTIEGIALRYGEVATGAPFPERFEAGAFQLPLATFHLRSSTTGDESSPETAAVD